ncbi:MAG: proteasome-type protease [Pirellulaceae bacterium]|nr:proteasome-type protease [Pirellulaceae bacterium]
MTFCIGIRVREGIVALADTRIVRGSEQLNKQKLAEFLHKDESLFTMTSGLRSIRDKTLVYVEETLRDPKLSIDRLYQFVNVFGDQLRRVRHEDGAALASAGLLFNLHAIIGGSLGADPAPQLFYVYSEGNWLEASPDSPYFIIGRTYYGKFILDRLLNYDSSLQSALALALLAFDATRTSVTDVDYPIDVAVIANGNRRPVFRRYDANDLQATTLWWSQVLSQSLKTIPMDWAQELLSTSGTARSGQSMASQDSHPLQPEPDEQ